jgi:hypothetical protein
MVLAWSPRTPPDLGGPIWGGLTKRAPSCYSSVFKLFASLLKTRDRQCCSRAPDRHVIVRRSVRAWDSGASPPFGSLLDL